MKVKNALVALPRNPGLQTTLTDLKTPVRGLFMCGSRLLRPSFSYVLIISSTALPRIDRSNERYERFPSHSWQASWPWVKEVSRGFVAFIGIAELLGVLVLILPQATNIAPVLTPIAAIGLAAIVLFGAVFHAQRKEYKEIGVNIVFLALAVLVAIGRM